MVGKKEEGTKGKRRERKGKGKEGRGRRGRKSVFLMCLTYLPLLPEASCIFPSPSAMLVV